MNYAALSLFLVVAVFTSVPPASSRAQDLIRSGPGVFLCHGDHPRCSVPDQTTYGYPQFGGQHVGQKSGVSDVVEDGPPMLHYQSWLAEVISKRPDTNVVAAWSDASAVTDGARVWGGFISARSGFPNPGQDDAQLIGLEIDVLNGGLPGVYPNASKVGLQIVGFGNRNTNAMEVLTETPSGAFMNILSIQPNAVAPDGTVIGMAAQTAARGIDFQGVTFTDAAMIVSANQKLSFRAPGLGEAAIWRDDISNGSLVLQSGPAGTRVVNSANNTNLLIITPSGDLITPYGSLSDIVARLEALETRLQ